MTPKEKAKELFEKFYYVRDEQGFHSVNKYRAKQCALKAVDELIDENEYLEEIVKAGLKKQFWEEVKQEIEKLL